MPTSFRSFRGDPLFRGPDLSAPPRLFSCGVDPTLDFFPGCDDPSCRRERLRD